MRPDLQPLVNIVLILLALFYSTNNIAQDAAEPIVIGHKLKIHSTVLNEDRELLIYTPASYEYSDNRYPVLYLLDGTNNFHHTTGIVKFLVDNNRMPETMVVALPNTDRTRDLTPPTQVDSNNSFPTSGGADNFLRFISDELIPYVESNYRTHPNRTLVGHSYGGLFAIHSLFTRPEVFNNYIAISPSLWWNDAATVAKAESFLENNSGLNINLYMTMGNEGGDMLGSGWRLSAILEEEAPDSFHWEFNLMEKEDHGSVPHRSTYQGLEFLHSGWQIPNLIELVENSGIEGVDKHFQKLSEKYGYTISTPEQTINQLGYWYMNQKKNDAAITLFKRNVINFPKSANVYDSLGDGYKANDQLELARDNYSRAVDLAKAISHANLDIFQSNLEEIEKMISSK